MPKIIHQASTAIRRMDTTVKALCDKHGLNENSMRTTLNGKRPSWQIASFFAKNYPEIFNLLPENSRKLVKGEYPGCNIPKGESI